jgi:hypothetical protein
MTVEELRALDQITDINTYRTAKASKPQGQYAVLPTGKYEVFLSELEIKATKTDGKPMLVARFKVLKGAYIADDAYLRIKLMGTKSDARSMDAALNFLKSLDAPADKYKAEFASWVQFGALVEGIKKYASECREYVIDFDGSAYITIKIVQVFDVTVEKDLPF